MNIYRGQSSVLSQGGHYAHVLPWQLNITTDAAESRL